MAEGSGGGEEGNAMESRIQQAMRSRVQHFRDQADSLTFEGVRRLLEKDLNLDKFALDVHKRYVKQLVEKYLSDANDENNPDDFVETKKEVKGKESELPEEYQTQEKIKEPASEDEEKMEESPVMGLLTESKLATSENSETGDKKKEIPSESTITKALWKRAAYFKSKSEEITVSGVRRLLEEDLELEKYTLDAFKKLISKQLDEVLNTPKSSATPAKKKSAMKPQSKTPKKTSAKKPSDSSDDGESDDTEDERKRKKKESAKGKLQKAEGSNKRKRPAPETTVSKKKPNKIAKEASDGSGNSEDGGIESDNGQSESSAEKPLKKKEVSTPAYGKQVEHLKSIIKSCGMSVPPTVYKKVKQVSDNKREAFLIKELEDILSKEGLSANSTEKEIKEVKRKKQTAKELEGIDTSNIVVSSRRRSTASFVPPPKPVLPDESDGDDTDDSGNDEDDEEDDGGENDVGEDSDASEEGPEDDEDSD